MKSLLYGTLLGLGLGLGSCASSSNHQKGDPTPQLYYQLLGRGQTAKDGTKFGDVTLEESDRIILARAAHEPNGQRYLDILVMTLDGEEGILFRDGGKGPLDGSVNDVHIKSSYASQLFVVENAAAANPGYTGLVTTLTTYLLKTPVGNIKKAEPNETIETFLKPSGKGK